MLGLIGKNPKFHKKTAWPRGSNGPLVLNGTTLNLPAGSIKDYKGVSLINGAVLNILPGTGWTAIGCFGNFTVDATSRIKLNNCETIFGANLTAIAPDKTVLTRAYGAVYGGDAGAAGDGTAGGAGTGTHGGGGGGGSGAGNNSDNINGGLGGGGGGDSGPGGDGGIGPGGNGVAGADGSSNGGHSVGGGGGGGAPGFHGGSLYLKVTGTISVSGVNFEAIGGDAGNGADGGGAGDPTGSSFGGGGGGGGTGGSGGTFKIRYKLGSVSGANCNVGFGAAGIAGNGGGHGPDMGGGADGLPGNDGSPGDPGVTDIASY